MSRGQYLIIYCRKCGMPQYVHKDQKTRKCPKCRTRINIRVAKVFGRADSEMEASQIVREMKTPSEIEQRIAALKATYSGKKSSKTKMAKMFGDLLSELVAVFPNALPKKLLFDRASEIGLTDTDYLEQILQKMNQEGVLLINKDGLHNTIIKFPSLPLKFGNVYIQSPKKTRNKSKFILGKKYSNFKGVNKNQDEENLNKSEKEDKK